MTTMTDYPPGTFCWVDYMARDMSSAEPWYAELFGWTVHRAEGESPYAVFRSEGKTVAGMRQMTEAMLAVGMPPIWNDYIAVRDVSATARKVVELGGNILVPPLQVSNAGWLAFFIDPDGACFSVWQAGENHGAELIDEPGSVSWNELTSRDVSGAKNFYGELFGWTGDTAPADGVEYTTLKSGERAIGGIMPMEGEGWDRIPPFWLTHFAVDDCDAIAQKAVEMGGTICVPPTDILPGRFAMLSDPQGGVFGAIKVKIPR